MNHGGESRSPPESQTIASRDNKRHVSRGSASYPRKRAVTACQVCRARRTKCDNKKPSCSFCAANGIECISSPVDFSSFDPASLQILTRLGDLEQLIRQQGRDGAKASPDPRIAITSLDEVKFYPESIEKVLEWPVFNDCFRDLPSLCTLLQLPPTGLASQPLLSETTWTIDQLQPRTCNRLLDDFYAYIHVKNPVTDETYVRRNVRRIAQDGFGWDSESCLALLVCALGAIASPFDAVTEPSRSGDLKLSQSLFTAATRRMGPLIMSTGIIEAQCFLFAGVYLMYSLQPLKAWKMFLQALACCQDFGIASKLDQQEGMPFHNHRQPMAECLYWACWKSEREVRSELRPAEFRVQDLALPKFFPTPPLHSTTAADRSWYYYLAECSLRRLQTRARIQIKEIERGAKDDSLEDLSDAIRAFESDIDGWRCSLPPSLSLDVVSPPDDELKFVLRGQSEDYYEAIYSPFVDMCINEPNTPAHVDAFASRGLQSHVTRLAVNKPGFRHRHHGTWLMLRACTRSALVLLAAASQERARKLLPEGWQVAIESTIELLEFWLHDSEDTKHRLELVQSLYSRW